MSDEKETEMPVELEKRPIMPALKSGLMRKCPNCGEGQLFAGYLKVHDHCAVCSQDFTPQRADDGPAWATMLITGHLVPPVILGIYDFYDQPNPFIVGLILVILFTAITLLLLPRVKGGFIAIQWANYMYGFNPNFKGDKRDQTIETRA